MRIGVVTEVKNSEFRVALTPAGAHELILAGHEVAVQQGAGIGSAFPDDAYADVGAWIAPAAADVWGWSELLLKVKEPVASEYPLLRRDLVLFTYLHLAADEALTRALLGAGTTAIAYETVQLPDRSLPLLAPMSEVAGRLSVQVGAYQLMKDEGGRGVLLGGVPGTPRAKVVIIGGGVAGEHAAEVAIGMLADVTVLDVSVPRLRALEARFGPRVHTLRSNPYTVAEETRTADLVVGAVLVPGARAPKLVTEAMVTQMNPGSVLVDIAVDQGGCFEGTRPTTYAEPTFRVHDSTFYCVANMPGAVPITSTVALTNVTLPYVAAIAANGWESALGRHPELLPGVSTTRGRLTSEPVANAHGLPHEPLAVPSD
ncbi:alanine dehydrogenase [Occultella glacieicola]|uniref:Alanine dehydrogenase n=1 Tax=Occultella glacieicola TaxID=2518684 RepID=A0ABY2E0K3_9MICO|nr:alanine dehydrogenase [Occultella glacieicola]TDE91461.1 alanine dehydrogenase [Occultella glacieicola]